jgi:hypothetical protein
MMCCIPINKRAKPLPIAADEEANPAQAWGSGKPLPPAEAPNSAQWSVVVVGFGLKNALPRLNPAGRNLQ